MGNPQINSEDALLRETAEKLGMEFYDSVPESFSASYTESIPLTWVRARQVLPGQIEGRPVLFTSSPTDIESLQKADLAAGVSFTPLAASRKTVSAAIERYYAIAGLAKAGGRGEIGDMTAEEDTARDSSPEQTANKTDLLASSEGAPVTRLVNSILLDAVRQRASDIHFEPFSDRLSLRFRIDGILYDRPAPPKHLESSLISRLKVMAGMDIAEKRLPQDGMAQAGIGDKSVDIRVSTVPVADGERVVLRLLNRSDTLRPMTSLGMTPAMLDSFRALLRNPNGIIIVSGPTGSGKTTTLYSALGEIDSRHRNVLTIEDPVEYRLPNIGQIQVKPKIGLTFSAGLRHILRQDPDVVLVGETRDPETAEIAVRASLTGHLVFTTLHTNDAPSAVTRLADMGIPPYLLASSLRGVLSQRLVRSLCPHCSVSVSFEEASKNLAVPERRARLLANADLKKACGCEHCMEGYSGRIGLFELMTVSPELRGAIRECGTSDSDFRQAAVNAGMQTIEADGIAKAACGITDLAEITGVLVE